MTKYVLTLVHVVAVAQQLAGTKRGVMPGACEKSREPQALARLLGVLYGCEGDGADQPAVAPHQAFVDTPMKEMSSKQLLDLCRRLITQADHVAGASETATDSELKNAFVSPPAFGIPATAWLKKNCGEIADKAGFKAWQDGMLPCLVAIHDERTRQANGLLDRTDDEMVDDNLDAQVHKTKQGSKGINNSGKGKGKGKDKAVPVSSMHSDSDSDEDSDAVKVLPKQTSDDRQKQPSSNFVPRKPPFPSTPVPALAGRWRGY